ncbi:hypothetical protein E2C01_001038 [Portunus trituberculatus]|uniref:Uncharacterized protein n=1 Tax=Portunus trituberculatus TaxID=210409 RepID=A0A5B7CI85_PORTR|nr:hypothetical protein [Portunus trituberculatus]
MTRGALSRQSRNYRHGNQGANHVTGSTVNGKQSKIAGFPHTSRHQSLIDASPVFKYCFVSDVTKKRKFLNRSKISRIGQQEELEHNSKLFTRVQHDKKESKRDASSCRRGPDVSATPDTYPDSLPSSCSFGTNARAIL